MERLTMLERAMAQKYAVEKAVAGAVLMPVEVGRVIKAQAQLVCDMAAALDALRKGKGEAHGG